MDELTCANCNERVEFGERHRLTTGGLAHDRCIIDRSTPLEWDRNAHQMCLDDLIIGIELDFEHDLPDWIFGAANADRLRDGRVGYIDMMIDGSIQFRETN